MRRSPFSRRRKSGRQCGQRAAGLARFLPSAEMASPFWASLTCSWKTRSRRGLRERPMAGRRPCARSHSFGGWTVEAADAVTSVEPEPNVADHEAVPLIPQQAQRSEAAGPSRDLPGTDDERFQTGDLVPGLNGRPERDCDGAGRARAEQFPGKSF